MQWYQMDHNRQMEVLKGRIQGKELVIKADKSHAGIQLWALVDKYRGAVKTGYDMGMNMK